MILLMAEILHQFIGSLSMFIPLFIGFHTSQVVIAGFLNRTINSSAGRDPMTPCYSE